MISWDERYAGDEYVYGTSPNLWLVAQSRRLPRRARVLALGEGEGRNAVWLAQEGHDVHAVDGSGVGLAKARRLAETRGVHIETTVADLAVHLPAPGAYDAVVLVFVHLPPDARAAMHRAAEEALSPGGLVLLEAFTPRQLQHGTGGPRDAAMLYEPAALRSDFARVSWDVLEEVEVDLDEGALHRGRAAVVRGVGRRTG